MSSASKKDEIIEVLDVRGRGGAKNWLQEYLADLNKASAAKQITVGGISGWCAGYLFTKVGKIAAVSIGGSLLLLQVASHQGYIKVNWSKVNRHVVQAKKEIEKEAKRKVPRLVEETRRFVKDNVVLATGFAGGFLLGLASS